MKNILLLILLAMLASCEDRANEISLEVADKDMPAGLRDCQMFEVRKNVTTLYVMRCPDSETATTTLGDGENIPDEHVIVISPRKHKH